MSQKTVRVRIAVGVSRAGVWAAYGWGDSKCKEPDPSDFKHNVSELMGDHPLDIIRYVEADVPVPMPTDDQVIEGEVQPDEKEDK